MRDRYHTLVLAPHLDDAALSCGGLIASLRELGQSGTIITVGQAAPLRHTCYNPAPPNRQQRTHTQLLLTPAWA